MTDSDATLIRTVLAGNVDAFGPLVVRYQEGVFALAWSIVRDFASAEDVAQEAFITAYTRLSELRDPAAFPAWLRRITANTARMWLRKESSRETTNDMNQFVAASESGASGFREEVTAILGSLPQKKRQVAILCYLDGVSRKDAAHFFGVSETAIRKRLHDAKRLLQRRIVEAAERSLDDCLLPKGFASRCVCGCKRALDRNERKVVSMAGKKNNCRCGCLGPKRTKARSRSKSKTTKAPKTAR